MSKIQPAAHRASSQEINTVVPGLLIQEITAPEQLQVIKALFEEYWNSLGFDRGTFGFGAELDTLPGEYIRPAGRLATASLAGQAVGCIALRPLNESGCEMKRLFVRASARGHGVAASLLTWLISEARLEGYSRMLADTLPSMTSALRLYEKFGFKRTGPYSPAPTPGAIY